MNDRTLTLDNCDQEPIHVPGAIQPHGALLAVELSDLKVRRASENVGDLLGAGAPAIFGAPIERVLDAAAAQTIRSNAQLRTWSRLNPIPVDVKGRRFDAIVHRAADELVIELEPTQLVAQGSYRDYGADTHQAMVRLQGADSLPRLLQDAAEAVRWVTGYDRVMIYRFSDEGHGEVVAEDRAHGLEPFLGLHYPASDIPAQARRLYTLNWLRVIVDVSYRRAEVLEAPSSPARAPLDMTYSTLRSVSPIHCEYLRNMGVGASMSVSLIQDGKLWGLIACHHYAPKVVPYSVRMTCELVGQMLSTLIASSERKEEAALRERLGERQVRLLNRLARAPYVAAALSDVPADVLELIGATGAAILEDGRFTGVGAAPDEAAVRAFARWMSQQGTDWLATAHLRRDHADAPSLGPDVAGVLAVGFPSIESNMVLWSRPAVEKTVSWAGNPEKVYAVGPNGPRLSPRGSFSRWRETVQHQSEPWSHAELDAVRGLRAGIGEAFVRRSREADQARDMLLGMISHDLRNPLSAITTAAEVLKTGKHESAQVTRASVRIAASSDRMRRMIEQLLDYTRSELGSLHMSPTTFDLVVLCDQLVEEVRAAHPGSRIETGFPARCAFTGDPDRIAQMLSNLLGNARHHGDPAHAIRFRLGCAPDHVALEITNKGPVIPPEKVATIFEPFKRARGDERTSAHSSGLGLGLYIVKRVVELHHGQVALRSSLDEGTTVIVTLPIASSER